MAKSVTNIVVAGLGGQGVLTASAVLAEAAVRAGFDVKKSEIKGMSQRGGSVSSDVRFGPSVLSPMVPAGEADFLLVLEPTQVEPNRHMLKSGGTLITPAAVEDGALPNRKALNVALLGVLSASLPIPETHWTSALRDAFPPQFAEANEHAFQIGRSAARSTDSSETKIAGNGATAL